MSTNRLITIHGTKMYGTRADEQALETLTSSNAGGFAVIHDYVSSTNRVTPETADIYIISRFSYPRLLERKITALKAIEFDHIKPLFEGIEKLQALDDQKAREVFNTRVQKEIDSAVKTLDGDRSDAYREAHDKFYFKVADGIRVHYQTIKTATGTELLLCDGLPVIESIMLSGIQVKKVVKEPGEYKKVNSGAPVLMSGIISKLLPKGVKYKQYKLSPGKFSSVSIANETLDVSEFS